MRDGSHAKYVISCCFDGDRLCAIAARQVKFCTKIGNMYHCACFVVLNNVHRSKNTKIATERYFENMPGQNIWYLSISNNFIQHEFTTTTTTTTNK